MTEQYTKDTQEASPTISANITGDLTRLGFSIIPVHRDTKRPAIRWKMNQTKRATAEQIEKWKISFPECNWGAVWGPVSGNVISIDIDSAKAFGWCQQQGGFNETDPVFYSTGRGWQYLYRLPSELADSGRIDPFHGVEIRTSRHYSMLPPSIHPNGIAYKWQSKIPKSVEDIPFAPQWVMDILIQKKDREMQDLAKPKKETPKSDKALQAKKPDASKNFQTNIALLNTDGFKWLDESTFGRHSRNSAFMSMAIALRLAGISQDDAEAKLDKWRQSNTLPVYGSLKGEEKEPHTSIACIYRVGYGLTLPGLQKAVNTQSERMPEKYATELIRLLPSRRTSERQNDPLFVTIAAIIETLYKGGILTPTPISHNEMALLTGRTVDQIAKVSGFFTDIGIRTITRIGRSSVSSYSLRGFNASPATIIKRLARWRGYHRNWKSIAHFLWRRVRSLMKTVLLCLNKVLGLIAGALISVGRESTLTVCRMVKDEQLDRGPPARCHSVCFNV